MKIYRVDDLPTRFRPDRQGFVWPPQNGQSGGDRGVEQDFDEWLLTHPDLLADSSEAADWIYLPLFWNRYFFANLDEDGHWGGGREALNAEVQRCRSEYAGRIFTIAEADVRTIKPEVQFGDMQIFCASRRADQTAIDIPLLSARHGTPEPLPKKRWLASFQGNLETDGIRMQMREVLSGRADCKIEHTGVPEAEFVHTILESYIALAPRGHGAQSFRFYEAMELGVCPLYISDEDCRPFRDWLDWESCSLWVSDCGELTESLERYDRSTLRAMGRRAALMYSDYLAYGKWCRFVIKELELL